MSCTFATVSGVTAFDRRFAGRRDERRGVSRAFAVSVGTVTVTGGIASAATLTAACIIGLAIGGAPHLRAGAPLALRAPAASYNEITDAFDQLAAAAKVAATAQTANEAAKGSKLAAARSALNARLAEKDITASVPRSSAPSYRLASAESGVPLPAPRPFRQHAPESRQAADAGAHTAAAPVQVASAGAFNLFDPSPMAGGALGYAPAGDQPVSMRPAERASDIAMPRASDERQSSAHQNVATPAKPAPVQVASATPQDSSPFNFFKRLLPEPSHNTPTWLPGTDGHTAVYDIEAHTVYLPNGERLEAHSGLGDRLDDPRYIADKARGPTPPNVYQLTMRGELFHGVRALRLNPVNGSKMYGRDGILAHTYMLGPSGQSFGCVSFKDYQAFLKAYERGEIDRIVVVPHLDNRASAGGRDGV